MDATATRDLARLADRFNANGADSVASDRGVSAAMVEIGRRARAAGRLLGLASTAEKNAALRATAASIRGSAKTILAANADDVAEAKEKDQPAAFIDRLSLDGSRVEAMVAAVESIAALPDPVGRVLAA